MEYMTRSDVIQAVLDTIDGKRYLEIGVSKRENFDKIIVKQKIGIDPGYWHPNRYLFKIFRCFPWASSCHRLLRKGRGEKYFQMTSSRFFEDHAAMLIAKPLDVCFIDGLHTFAQSLDDTLNCLKYLSHSGVVVIHDCCPTDATLALPAGSFDEIIKMNLPRWQGGWCGDVWKTIVYLRSQRPDLRVCVLDMDAGIGVVTRGKPENMLTYSREEIDQMTYEDLDAARAHLLNLKDPGYLNEILKSLAR